MSGRDARIALKHMRDHAREALDMFEGRTRSDLDTDRMLSLALVGLLEIVGEAATQVLSLAGALTTQSDSLREAVNQFLVTVRSG